MIIYTFSIHISFYCNFFTDRLKHLYPTEKCFQQVIHLDTYVIVFLFTILVLSECMILLLPIHQQFETKGSYSNSN